MNILLLATLTLLVIAGPLYVRKTRASISLLLIMMFGSIVTFGQNISVTFTGTGAATQIDSITATNLTTNQSVTFPGKETLVLTGITGIPAIAELANPGIVYPNPFSGQATFIATYQNPQTVYLKIQNLIGQVVAQKRTFVEPGENEFVLSVNTAGIYLITLTTDQGTTSYKIICTEATDFDNRIQYLGSVSNNHNSRNNHNNSSTTGLKTSQTSYSLEYTEGDILLYRCRSGIYSTIVTDTLPTTKNYQVEFVGCTDDDRKNYSIVKIGNQTWMAENLAYLPSVSPSSSDSYTSSYYYINGYEENSVSAAKATTNYSTYGVLYNWVAAKEACPLGWHLPTDEEWTTLTEYLGSSAGGLMKEAGTTHWESPNEGANNASGFTVLPGGVRYGFGGFDGLGYYSYFWSSSESGASDAWVRSLGYGVDGVSRDVSYLSYGFSVRCVKDDTDSPIARFSVNSRIGTPSTIFQFDASASTDNQTAAENLEVRWDWNGDGIWDTRYDPTKTCSFHYPEPGGYTVILEVKDGDGFIDTETKIVTVGEGTFTDSRDGIEYPYITYGNQTWMIGNLAYLPSVSPTSTGSDTTSNYYVYGYNGSNVGEAKATTNYSTYGVLYNWEAAKAACPSGWHIPTSEEWTNLTDYLTNNGYGYEGSGSDIGKSMAATSGWESYGSAGTVGNDQKSNNRSGFTALPGGYKAWPSYRALGTNATFWMAYEINVWSPWIRELSAGGDNLDTLGRFPITLYKTDGFSVRCEKDGYTLPIARFTISPPSGVFTTTFQFDASGSTDVETPNRDLEVRWDWNGDSIWDTPYDTTKTHSFQYADPGTYSVILEVKDSSGLVNATNQTLVVRDTAGCGKFTDSRDGREYNFLLCGSQTWMAENLAYLPAVSPPSAGSLTAPYYYVNGYVGDSVGAAKNTDNFTTYGVLYNWEAAKMACPPGWHLPSDEEWKVLEKNLGMSDSDADASNDWRRSTGTVGGKLKEAGTTHWSSPNTGGKNSSGFTALPGSNRFSYNQERGFGSLGYSAWFWSGSEIDESYSWARNLSSSDYGIGRNNNFEKWFGFSVRCLKGVLPIAIFTISPQSGTTSTTFQFDASASTGDETAKKVLEVRWDWDGDGTWDTGYDTIKTAFHQYNSDGAYRVILAVRNEDGLVGTAIQTVTVGFDFFIDSRDGNEYFCRTIGSQTWMMENLAYLPIVSPSSTHSGTEKLYHVYKYQGTSITEARESDNYKTYGVLYNWPAAMNADSGSILNPSGVQGACPSGWHLPSDAEWTVLTDYLGPTAGNKMKAASGWSSGNGDNSSLFNALPGGYRNLSGGFAYLGKNAWFWSASADGPENALVRYLDGYFDGVIRDTKSRGYGYSVRCVRD